MSLVKTLKLPGLLVLLLAAAVGCGGGGGGGDDKPAVVDSTDQFRVAPSAALQENSAQGVTVVVPGGLLTSEETLKITKVSAPPSPFYKGLEIGGTYDIQLGDLHQFDQELTVRMKYDPAQLRTDLPLEQLLSAGYWDEKQNVWVSVPLELDQTAHEVVVRTKHLSMFSWFMKATGYSVFFKNNFYVTYNKAEVTDPNFLMYYKNPDTSNYVDINVPNYVEDVMDFLIDAYKTYVDDYKFTAPSSPVDVYVGTDLSSFSEKFTGIILISLLPPTPEQLKMVTAHELFHRIQNRYYYDLGGMLWLTWWLEATADYAGDWVAWNGLNLMGGEGGIKRSYLEAPLTSTGGTHNDGYATAHFIKYLVDRGANFKSMWDATANPDWFDSFAFLDGLTTYLQTVHGTSDGVRKQFREFARYFVFDPTSPMPAVTNSLYTEVAQYKTSMSGNIQESVTVDLQGGYTAKLWGIWFDAAAFDPTTGKRKYSVSVDGALPSQVEFDVYVLKGDKRVSGGGTPAGTITQAQKYVGVEVEEGDAVYVLGVNANSSNQTARLKITEEAIGKVGIVIELTEVRSWYGSTPQAEATGMTIPAMGGSFTGDIFTALCDYARIDGMCFGDEYVKVTATFNGDRTMVTDFTLHKDVYSYHVDIEGKNIPLVSSSATELVYQVNGPSVCDLLTQYSKRNDTPESGYDTKSYSCDGASFIRITAKP